VENHALLSTGPRPLHRPPVVLGHEEDQDWLTRTDLPAAGWVGGRVWRNAEGLMLGDLVEVPGPVADAVNAGAFKKVSCEFYDDFKDNEGRSYGPALRRVALLGAEIPKVKGLADLPHAQFSDGLPARRAARALKFAEGKPVASDSGKGGGGLADAVKKMLKDSGLSDKTIGMLDGNEELMASLLADLTGRGPGRPERAGRPQRRAGQDERGRREKVQRNAGRAGEAGAGAGGPPAGAGRPGPGPRAGGGAAAGLRRSARTCATRSASRRPSWTRRTRARSACRSGCWRWTARPPSTSSARAARRSR
jgi:hypothetical protein